MKKSYKIDFARRAVTITKEFAAKAAEYNSYEYKILSKSVLTILLLNTEKKPWLTP